MMILEPPEDLVRSIQQRMVEFFWSGQHWLKASVLYLPLQEGGQGLLERQLLMQNQMRERQMAMQVAWSREFLKYFGSFFGLASLGLTIGAVKKRKPALLAPVFPLSFILVYQLDAAYGSLLHRMREEAESIMASESERLALPQGIPTFESIEKSRRAKAHLSSLLEK